MTFCSGCGQPVRPTDVFCAKCGTRNLVAATTAEPGPGRVEAAGFYGETAPQPGPVVYTTTTAPAGDRPSQGLAIAGLVLNVIIWPGLGSLIGGDNVGWAQGFLFLLGVILTVTIIGAIVGIPLMIGMWVWSIVTGVQLVNKAGKG